MEKKLENLAIVEELSDGETVNIIGGGLPYGQILLPYFNAPTFIRSSPTSNAGLIQSLTDQALKQ